MHFKKKQLVLETPCLASSPAFAFLSVGFDHGHALSLRKQRWLKAILCLYHPSASDLIEKKTPFS